MADSIKDLLATFDFPVLHRRLVSLGFSTDEIRLFQRMYDRKWESVVEKHNRTYDSMPLAYRTAYTDTARFMRVVIDWNQIYDKQKQEVRS